MNHWICSICGKDTKCVDMDYLIDYDHISCLLGVWGGKDVPTNKSKLKKPMKIKNWDKISGFTYKGYTIVNPAYGVGDKYRYYADVLNLNLPQKPKLTLELSLDKNNTLILADTNGLAIQHLIEPVDIRTISLFRCRYEDIIDEMLVVQLSTPPSSHSINISSSQSGILNIGSGSGYTTAWNPITHQNLPSTIVDTIKDLQRQIDELKLNTSTNPF